MASSKLKGGTYRLMLAAGFFCACMQIHGVTPVGNCNRTPAFEVLDNGSVTPFFCYLQQTNLSVMSSTEKNCSNGNIIPNQNRVTCESGIQFFSFNRDCKIRVVTIEGNPWFIASDICDALKLKNPSVTVVSLDDDERAKFNLGSKSNEPNWIVNESGLYFLMLRCRDAVKRGTTPYKFRKWVTSEVLPAIRKTGMYTTPQATEKLTGQYIQITGADGNLYLYFILKAVSEFIKEETSGCICSELRLVKMIEAARTVVKEDRKSLRNINVKVLQS